MNWISTNKRRIVTVILGIIGIAIALAYALCPGSCSALRGTLLSVDLKWVGVAFMSIIGLAAAAGINPLVFFLSASSVGAEIVLVAFQVRNDVYCSYCLAFGFVAVAMFIVNFKPSRSFLAAALTAILIGFLFFALFFEGTVIPVYSEILHGYGAKVAA